MAEEIRLHGGSERGEERVGAGPPLIVACLRREPNESRQIEPMRIGNGVVGRGRKPQDQILRIPRRHVQQSGLGIAMICFERLRPGDGVGEIISA